MSFDLLVLAAEPAASLDVVREMADHCTGPAHRDGELDPRIVAFYEDLRVRFPDHPPYDPESPWMSAPLAVGIDHVSMTISHTPRGSQAVDAVCHLAERHGLVIYDPQGDEVTGPTGPRRARPAGRSVDPSGGSTSSGREPTAAADISR